MVGLKKDIMTQAKIVFEDGKIFRGTVFAEGAEAEGEIVFNTAMSGYQEILTDPSYCGQIVVMTYPLIGSYGVNPEDVESRKVFLSAFVCKEYIHNYSGWRGNQSLKDYLEERNVLGVEGIDTRALTRYLRDHGAKRALVTTSTESDEALIARVAQIEDMSGKNLASEVTCTEPYQWKSPDKPLFNVAVIDCGVKHNILEMLRSKGCSVTVFPVSVDPKELLSDQFDGVFISNGPGDPEPVEQAIALVREVVGKKPLFGICLGHQILSLALGAKTYKLKFGHHGANHPVKNLETGRVEVTSQNHGFAVDPESINPDEIEITHLNLNDQTVAGIRHKASGAFSVQYHPEAAPGPHDSQYFFDDFVTLMDRQS